MDAGQSLLEQPIRSGEDLARIERERTRWHKFNIDLLKTLFDGGELSDEYEHVGPRAYWGSPTLQQSVQELHADLHMYLERLKSIMERMVLFAEAPTAAPTTPVVTESGSAVFIVHGHAGKEEAVARVVEGMGLDVVILKDEPH